MSKQEFEKVIETLADKAKLAEYNDLAVVLYTYLGSRKLGVSSDFARYCQDFAKEASKDIELFNKRQNN